MSRGHAGKKPIMMQISWSATRAMSSFQKLTTTPRVQILTDNAAATAAVSVREHQACWKRKPRTIGGRKQRMHACCSSCWAAIVATRDRSSALLRVTRTLCVSIAATSGDSAAGRMSPPASFSNDVTSLETGLRDIWLLVHIMEVCLPRLVNLFTVRKGRLAVRLSKLAATMRDSRVDAHRLGSCVFAPRQQPARDVRPQVAVQMTRRSLAQSAKLLLGPSQLRLSAELGHGGWTDAASQWAADDCHTPPKVPEPPVVQVLSDNEAPADQKTYHFAARQWTCVVFSSAGLC